MTVVCAFGLLTFSGELLAKTQRALPPHAVGAVRKLLDLRTPLDGGALGPLQLSASIERDRIAIVGKDAAQASALLVTLVHPDDAPAGAKRLGSVAHARSRP